MGGLPLALDQAGAYLEATGMPLQDYLQAFQSHQAALLRERRSLVFDHPEPVASTWSLSFERVEQRDPAAADLLRICAYLAPDTIPEEVLIQGSLHLGPILEPTVADPLLLGKTIEVLRRYSLLRRDPRTRLLSVHRLVQAVVRDAMSYEERTEWVKRTIQVVSVTFPGLDFAQRMVRERWLPHALQCAAWIEQEPITVSESANLLHYTAQCLVDRVQYAEAEPLYQRALRIYEQGLGPEHPSTGTTLHGLARLYQNQGKYAEAEPLYQRALRIKKKP
jgi:tetratricopeptide (TPR) repeat protein